MALTNNLFNPMLDAAGTEIGEVSLHDADPGATGTDELTGGSYARAVPAWGAASGGSVQTSAAMDFTVPGGSTVAWVGLWDGAGTTFLGGVELATTEVFAADGTYTVTNITLTLANA
jgi:hypothetical protein